MINLKLNSFENIRIIVVGDVMIDQYMFGQVFRHSPEADIPVLENVTIDSKLGGAGNVALNIKRLGASVKILSVTGDDYNSRKLLSELDKEGIEHNILKDPSRQTTVKTRIFQDTAQKIRVDQEDKHSLDDNYNQQLLKLLETECEVYNPQIVILQDYNKGVLNKTNIPLILRLLKEKKIFTSVDPKIENFLLYRNVNIFKPNLDELLKGSQYKHKKSKLSIADVVKLSQKIRKQIACETILVTLSERGALIIDNTGHHHLAAESLPLVDVCGAGDAVISIITMLSYKNVPKEELTAYCNKTGRIVCQKTGVAPIEIKELLDKTIF